MRCACPSCGRRTEVEEELGDFPTPCQRCGALLRPPLQEQQAAGTPRGRPVFEATEAQVRAGRAPAGALAGLLTARPNLAADPARITGDNVRSEIQRIGNVIRVDEVARVHARQKAMRRAQLTGSLQSLGALGTVGIALIALLCVAAVALGLKSVGVHPRASRAEAASADRADSSAKP